MDERICPPDPGPGGREVEPPRGAGWVLLNGRRHPLPGRCNVVQLLQRLGIDPEAQGVAVAVNDRVVRRQDWGAQWLAPDDHVEVVRAVQGG